MAEAIWDFVATQQDLRPFTQPISLMSPGTASAAVAQASAGHLWGCVPLLLLESGQTQPYMFHIVEWQDDPYSRDLARQFSKIFSNPDEFPVPPNNFYVPYSVGPYMKPNPREALVVQALIRMMPRLSDERILLILPAVDRPVRRFLRSLAVAAPREIGSVVAVTGDSVAFNTLYKDRAFWNIQDLPVPIVVFCHHNPVAWEGAGPIVDAEATRRFVSGTDDELLNADIVETLVEAAFGLAKTASARPAAKLLADANLLNDTIKRRRADYFGPDGNRRGGVAEYLATLRPVVRSGRVQPWARLEVWTRSRAGEDRFWDRVKKIKLSYGDTPEEDDDDF